MKKELLKVKGIGTYAAEHLLKLLGRYDGLALDSWLRAASRKSIIGTDRRPTRRSRNITEGTAVGRGSPYGAI
ncbi:MAG: hypothetical protein IPM21_02230 [Acidobacteria bacterium]|nr:hypothetical protein [Acidobacteriota bacterium]